MSSNTFLFKALSIFIASVFLLNSVVFATPINYSALRPQSTARAENQFDIDITIDYADDGETFYAAIKDVIGDPQKLTKKRIKDIDAQIRDIAKRVKHFVAKKEQATGYSLWNIQEEHISLYSLKQFALAYTTLERAFEIIELSHYDRTKKDELIEIVQYFFYAALPEFIDGRKANPIHHNIQALENMLHIAITEKPDDYEFLKKSVVLVLLHDIGNSQVSGEKVTSSELKTLKKAMEEAESEEDRRACEERLHKRFTDAVDFRRSHMIAGATMIKDLISAYEKNIGRTVFTDDDITDICAVIRKHDNPSIAKYKKDILGELDDSLLFSRDDELGKFIREADRLWMLSPEGFEKDLISGKKSEFKTGEKAKNPEEQLIHNKGEQCSEYVLYQQSVPETELDAYEFNGETLYRTDSGYALYQEFSRRSELLIQLSDPRELMEDELIKALFSVKKRYNEYDRAIRRLKETVPLYGLKRARLSNDYHLAKNVYDKIWAKLSRKVKAKPMLVAFLGPSSSGKATAIQYLVKTYPEIFMQLIRTTDRPERKEEGDKKCISSAQFEKMRKNDEFLITTKNYGYNYGVTKKDWELALGSGKVILLEGHNTTRQILSKPELSSDVDVKLIGLYPADPNNEDQIRHNIRLREREIVRQKKGFVLDKDERDIRKRQADGIAITRSVRKLAKETIINIPSLMSKEDLYRSVEQRIISCFGLHNFADVARRINTIKSFDIDIPNDAKLVLRLREPGRAQISLTHIMFNRVFQHLFESGYIDDKFRMVPIDTENFDEGGYHKLLTAIKAGIEFDNDVSVVGLNIGAPYKGFDVSGYITNKEIMQDGTSFIVYNDFGELVGDFDEGKAFMAWFKQRYGRFYGHKVVLLGAGPTNVAIALEMVKTNVQKICITDKDYEKADRLADRLKEIGVDAIAVKADSSKNSQQGKELHEEIKHADVIINGTGVGKKPKSEGSPLIKHPDNPLTYKNGAILVDLDYNLGADNFLSQGRRLNPTVEAVNGVGLMIEYNTRQILNILDIPQGDPLEEVIYKVVTDVMFNLLRSSENIDWDSESTYVIDILPDEYLEAFACFDIPNILNKDQLKKMIDYVSRQGGTRGAVYKVTLKDSSQYVLKKEPKENQAMANLSSFYREHDIPYPAFLKTRQGNTFARVGNAIFTLQKVLPGTQPKRGNLSNMEVERVAQQLAEIHYYGAQYMPAAGEQSFQVGTDENFLQIDLFVKIKDDVVRLLDEIDDELSRAGIEKRHPWRDPLKRKNFKQALRERQTVEDAIEYIDKHLPTDVFKNREAFPRAFYVHGDFFQGNVLIQDSSLSGVFDLERSCRNATRWEDILTPMCDLNYHTHEERLSFDFDRFALWLTTYNHALHDKESSLALTTSEKTPEHLRSLFLMGYIQELHKGLKNRATWVKPTYVMAQVRNIQKVLDADLDKLRTLSRYLERKWIWDQQVIESKPWLHREMSNISALGLNVNSKIPEDREKVVRWLTRRVAKRNDDIVINEDIISALAHELSQTTLTEFVKLGKQQIIPLDDENAKIKQLIYQEAQLLACAIPSMGHKAEFREVDVFLDPGELERMRQARARFKNRYDELCKSTRDYWEDELPRYRGDMKVFNVDEDQKPEISIVIVSMANRLESSLLKRIQEMQGASDDITFEVNIVLADPENIPDNKRQLLESACAQSNFPIKLIESRKNTIVTNRNLGSLESSGEYIIFLDDDVCLVGNVITSLVDTLKKYSEIGVTQPVSYDEETGVHKPKFEYLKHAIDSQTVISTDIAGMIMATRANIVKVLPFIPFWPNFGEDGWFGKQVQGLGFFLSFVYSDNAYVFHKHVSSRVTGSPSALRNMLIHDTLSYYLNPERYDDMRDGKVIMRFKNFGGADESFEEIKRFWRELRNQVVRFLIEGEDIGFDDLTAKYKWAKRNSDAIKSLILFCEGNREQIVAFKKEYTDKNLTDINIFLGPLRYRDKKDTQREKADVMYSQLDPLWRKKANCLRGDVKLSQNFSSLVKAIDSGLADIFTLKEQFTSFIIGLARLYGVDPDEKLIDIGTELLREIARKYPVFINGWLSEIAQGLDSDAKQLLTKINSDVIRESGERATVVNLILAGGKGEAFYPLTGEGEPKQFLKFSQFEQQSLLENAIDLANSQKCEVTFILANPEIQQIAEQVAKGKKIARDHILVGNNKFPNTTAAIVFGLAQLYRRFGEDIVVRIVNVDSYFKNKDELGQSLYLAEALANAEPSIVQLAARTFPDVGCPLFYPIKEESVIPGLIRCSKYIGKPGSLEDAKRYYDKGALWYSGIRIGKISTLLSAIERQIPQYAGVIHLIKNAHGAEWQRASGELAQMVFEEKNVKGFSETVIWPLLRDQESLGIGFVKAPFGSHIGSIHYRFEDDDEIDEYGNAIRLFGKSKGSQVSQYDCETCDFIINADDIEMRAYGLKGYTIAYDGVKKVLIIVPADKAGKLVKEVIERLRANKNLKKYLDPSVKPAPSQRENEYWKHEGNNVVYFETNGDAFLTGARSVIVYCQNTGLIALSRTEEIAVIQDGNSFFIYGPSYKKLAQQHLQELQKGKEFRSKGTWKSDTEEEPMDYSKSIPLSDHARLLHTVLEHFEEFARFNRKIVERKKTSQDNIEGDVLKEVERKSGPLAPVLKGFDHFLRMGRGKHRFSYAFYRIGTVTFAVRITHRDFHDNLPVLFEKGMGDSDYICQIIEIDELMRYWKQTFPPDNADFVKDFTEQPYLHAMVYGGEIVSHGKRLIVEERIGQGHESAAYKVRDCKTNVAYVLKVGRANLKPVYDFWHKAFKDIRSRPDAKTLTPYLVEFYSYDPENNSILMEYFENAETFEAMYIKRNRDSTETMRALSIITNMARVLGVLYDNHIRIADAHSSNIMCRENSDACKFIDPTPGSNRGLNLERKNIFKIGASLYRMFADQFFPQAEAIRFRNDLARNKIDIKKAQEILDFSPLEQIPEQLKSIIIKALFATDDYYRSMTDLANDLENFLAEMNDAMFRYLNSRHSQADTHSAIAELIEKLGQENEKQAAYLAEEAYLERCRTAGEEEKGIIKLIHEEARRTFDAEKDPDKKTHLENFIVSIGRERTEEEVKQYEHLKGLLEEKPDIYGYISQDLSGKSLEEIGTIIAQGRRQPQRYKDVVFLPQEGTLYVISDTHGDSVSTEHIINEINFIERAEKGEKVYLVFLGDYINTGLDNIDNLIRVLSLKKRFPDHVILLSGNQEFRRTYAAILKECYSSHWDNATIPGQEFPSKDPRDSTHYGNIRLELINKFGIEKGEEIYRIFGEWGRSLPYVCFSGNGLMMSHSIGLPDSFIDKILTFEDLAGAKQDQRDIDLFNELGYRAWRDRAQTIHAEMVNNREIEEDLLDKFHALGVKQFIVGHMHYRSGDVGFDGKLITICSSDMHSPSAGHYMYREMVVEAKPGGSRNKEGRPGNAFPYYLETDLAAKNIDFEKTKRLVGVKEEDFPHDAISRPGTTEKIGINGLVQEDKIARACMEAA